MAEDSTDQHYKPGRSGSKTMPEPVSTQSTLFLRKKSNGQRPNTSKPIQRSKQGIKPRLGPALTEHVFSREYRNSFGCRQQLATWLETLILASECTLVCKMMHTVARIIRIDRQWRSITVVVTGAKGMPRAGARNAESGQKKG